MIGSHFETSLAVRNTDAEHLLSSYYYWAKDTPVMVGGGIALKLKKENSVVVVEAGVKVGVNVEIVCENLRCSMKGEKQIASLGVGMFDFVKARPTC